MKRINKDMKTGIKYSEIGLPKVLEVRKDFLMIERGTHPKFRTWDEFMLEIISYVRKIRPSNAVLDGAFLESTALDCLVRRTYESIFIESIEVADFIESNIISDKDIDSVVSVIEDYVNISENRPYEVLCINLPNRKYSLIVVISSTNVIHELFRNHSQYDKIYTGNKIFIGYIRNDGNGDEDEGFSLLDPPILDFTNHENIQVRTNWRIILNTFLYMSAFPECVKEGVPNIYLDEDERKVKSKTVSISDAMKEAYSHGPISPHMRRGHFRFLKSEKYKGKRFQTVYVKPTMVKGHAVTVMENET